MYFILAMVRGGSDTMFYKFGDLNANDRIVRQEVMKNLIMWQKKKGSICWQQKRDTFEIKKIVIIHVSFIVQ